ncbi:HAD-superfamily hydrolase, subfamily IA, variant 3 [Acidianus hospitalis W1]|uniref:HAD-superfamily hydrolase, subfamily IA, variant 3 n=2 Tax=Acidianus hospitalis TaxID=563177 RepID=F4B9I3_ACIHW|nr:HAD-superfamily hydrolase, subfamily IA, variant 3 [Acidianus hospitalis W1]
MAWELALKDLGIKIPVDLDKLMGRKTEEIAKLLAKDRWKELYERKNAYFDNLVKIYAKPTPCAIDLVNKLKKEKVKTAVVTSSLRRSAIESLKILNFEPDILVAGDDVKKGKPDPEPVLKALSLLGEDPRNVFGVGDTLQDVIAYYNSGIREIYLVKGDLKIDYDEAMRKYNAKVIETLCCIINH